MANRISLIEDEHGCKRCGWSASEQLYRDYHDAEWGVPEWDSRALFEKLMLDGFQAGLSWITILRKRDAFRAAFDNFDPEKMAGYDARKLARLMENPGIVRNRAKVHSSVTNAQAYLAIPDFSAYLWDFLDGKPRQNKFRTLGQVPAATPLAEKISKDLRKRGFNFCGPTIVYAFMQACGLVNDHLVGCHRHEPVAALGKK
jgi:DNA-3-methyladenine glycosylase I